MTRSVSQLHSKIRIFLAWLSSAYQRHTKEDRMSNSDAFRALIVVSFTYVSIANTMCYITYGNTVSIIERYLYNTDIRYAEAILVSAKRDINRSSRDILSTPNITIPIPNNPTFGEIRHKVPMRDSERRSRTFLRSFSVV
jgi:hypothetical protein